MTLEPGDVILTGTPAGSTVVEPGDLVEVEVTAGDATTGRLRSPIVEAQYTLPPFGAMPRMTDEARDAAFGVNGQQTRPGRPPGARSRPRRCWPACARCPPPRWPPSCASAG